MKSYKFIILLFIFYVFTQTSLSNDIITVSAISDTLFVGDEITFFKNDLSAEVSLYFSLDSSKTWNLITDNLTQEFVWKLPFSLSRNIQFKATKKTIVPPKLIWDNNTAHIGEVRTVDISDDGKFIVSLGRDNYIKVWDIDARKCVDSLELGGTSYNYSAKFFHANTKILYSFNNECYIWDRSKSTNDIFYTLGDFIRSIDVHPTAKKFSVITNDNNLAVFNESFILPIPIFLHLYSNAEFTNFYSTRYSKNGGKIGISTYVGKIIVSEAQLSKQDSVYKADNNPIFALDFFDNDTQIAFGGTSSQLKLLNLSTSNITNVEPKFSIQIRDVRFNSPRNDLIAVSLDSNLRQWNASSLQQIDIAGIKEPFGIMCLDITSSGDSLVTCGRNNYFRLWENYSYLYEDQILKFEYRQKLEITLSSNKKSYIPSENTVIKVGLFSKFSDTLRNLGKWSLYTQISIPLSLLYLENEEQYNKSGNNLIIDSTQIIDFTSNLLYQITGKSLYANSESEIIDILAVNILPEDNFYIIKNNLNIEHNYFCNKENNPKILLEPGPIIELIKLSSKHLKISLKIFKEDKYNLSIYNYLGRCYKELYNSELKPGNYFIEDNLDMFPNGAYFILFKSSNNSKILKTILVE